MVTIKIYFRKHNPTSTSGVVWIQFYVNREKVNFSTGVKCEEKHWNNKKCCVGTGNKNELATVMVHKTVVRKIKEYAPGLHFDDIIHEWLDKYYAFLWKTLKSNENTAYKNMSIFRKYVRTAWKAGYMDENPFENWSIKRTKANYTYLTEDELKIKKLTHALRRVLKINTLSPAWRLSLCRS